jgi:rod shape-determining protein MreC
MNAILRDPPAFFNRGPSPAARLTFFAVLAVLLMIADHHFKAVSALRFTIGVLVEPVQRAAAWPVNATSHLMQYLVDQRQLIAENESLRAKLTDYARDAQAARLLRSEQMLITGMKTSRFNGDGLPAEVLYGAKKPLAKKLIIDKGVSHGVRPGMVVIDGTGVVGQITAGGPTTSELTLMTAKDHSIPVLVERTGLRAIAVGSGDPGTLELPYLPGAADVREGDTLVTSGIDGTYPPGLTVGTVQTVERSAAYNFPKVAVRPASAVDRHRLVMVLLHDVSAALPPVDIPSPAPDERRKRRALKREG